MARSANRSLWLLGAAMAYIVLQFGWWAVLLLRREEEIARLSALTQEPGPLPDRGHRMLMVVGEAGVLLLLLGAVLAFAFLAIRRDLRLANLQRNFLLAITHELRTPIASIKLQLQTLSRPDLRPSDAQMLRDAAITEADRLSALTDKVLAATAAGEGEVPLRKEPMDAAAAVAGALERTRQRDAGAHLWQADLPAALEVRADPEAFRSIVENLLENAVKYAPAGTTITISLRGHSDRWELEVADQGPGIPPSEREKVFERFYRSGSEETRQHPGTGLGLYVVRRLVRRHGGRITVRDAAPHGAIFTASFPKGS